MLLQLFSPAYLVSFCYEQVVVCIRTKQSIYHLIYSLIYMIIIIHQQLIQYEGWINKITFSKLKKNELSNMHKEMSTNPICCININGQNSNSMLFFPLLRLLRLENKNKSKAVIQFNKDCEIDQFTFLFFLFWVACVKCT